MAIDGHANARGKQVARVHTRVRITDIEKTKSMLRSLLSEKGRMNSSQSHKRQAHRVYPWLRTGACPSGNARG